MVMATSTSVCSLVGIWCVPTDLIGSSSCSLRRSSSMPVWSCTAVATSVEVTEPNSLPSVPAFAFTVMTAEGLPEAGWNTFSAYDDEGVTVVQVQSLARTNDPIYEFGFRFIGGARQQEKIWAAVLTALAGHLGVSGRVETDFSSLDNSLQWSGVKNVWHNAIIRTVLYKLAAPLRWLKR